MTTLYSYLVDALPQADERTSDWPLISSSVPLLVITFSYLYFVLKCGPDYMRDRKPYNLKTAISLYNICQVLACSYIFYELLASGWWNDYSLGCQPVDRSRSPKAMRMATTLWWLMILKLSEYIETIFFVLRKKNNQITKLHVYHHTSTLYIAWSCAKFSPGGMASFSPMPNCLVHVMMYIYYLVSLHAGDELQSKLSKWKRYLTLIQMVQLFIILLHSFQGLHPSCDMNKVMMSLYIPNVFLVFYLFSQFYRKSYNKTK